MVLEPLALLDQVFDHVISLYFGMQSIKIGHTRSLDVQRTADLVDAMRAVRIHLLEEVELRELPRLTQGVHLLSLTPLGELREHQLHLGLIELSRTTESQNVSLVEQKRLHVYDLLASHPVFNHCHHCFLFRGEVPQET